MGYDYTCDRCGHEGENPALMGSFSKKVWTTTELGGSLQEAGYELGDTITFCSDCTATLLT